MAAVPISETTFIDDANLKAYYRLENVNDATANAYNLTNNGTTPFNAAKFNNGADFGASNSTKYLSTTSNLGIDGGNISIVAWINFTTLPGLGVESAFTGHGSSTNNIGNRLFMDNSAGVYTFRARRTKFGVSNIDSTRVFTPSTGIWYHVAYVYDGSNVLLYFNGVAQTPTAVSGNGTSGGTAGFAIGTTPDSYGKMSGLADDVAVFNRALTAAEVLSIYDGSAAKPTSGFFMLL